MAETGYEITLAQYATKSAISANPEVDQASLAALIPEVWESRFVS